jgi:hypothetical protein
MIILLITLLWLASLGLFVGLRARATKSRPDGRIAGSLPNRREAPRSTQGRGAISLGSSR